MIEGKKIILAQFESWNASSIQEWQADPYYKYYFKNMPELLTESQLTDFPRLMGMNILIIYERGEWYATKRGITHFYPKPLGLCSWDNIRILARTCEFGILIDRHVSGQHYGKEAIFLFLNYLFNRLGFHKVSAHTAEEAKDTNEKCMKALGMTEEGIIRENFYLDGQWKNEKRWSILQNEFNEIYQKWLNAEEVQLKQAIGGV